MQVSSSYHAPVVAEFADFDTGAVDRKDHIDCSSAAEG
jgi:hypothetical protein